MSKALVLHPQDIAWPERVETIGPSNPINTAQPPTALEAPQPHGFFSSPVFQMRLTEGQNQRPCSQEEALQTDIRVPALSTTWQGRLCLCDGTIISTLPSAKGVSIGLLSIRGQPRDVSGSPVTGSSQNPLSIRALQMALASIKVRAPSPGCSGYITRPNQRPAERP